MGKTNGVDTEYSTDINGIIGLVYSANEDKATTKKWIKNLS